MLNIKLGVERCSVSSSVNVSRQVHAVRPTAENARSPSLVRVVGTTVEAPTSAVAEQFGRSTAASPNMNSCIIKHNYLY